MKINIKEKIKQVIQILGKPVMSYAPKIAIEEYDKKIKEATEILLSILINKENKDNIKAELPDLDELTKGYTDELDD